MSYRVEFFDIWQAGYGGAAVAVYVAGTRTLASLYRDEALTDEEDNPRTLLSATQNGVQFGKFPNPIYTNQAYELVINSTDQTGIIRPPLTNLIGVDASEAVLTVEGGTEERTLAEMYAGLSIDVLNYGEFLPVGDPDYSASTNAATLVAAIGVAAALGGGYVDLPAGTYRVTTASVPGNVILRGKGRDVTILQSVTADEILTATGAGAGLAHMTLDGVSKQAGSTGFYSKAIDEIIMDHVLVKRFETGLHHRGGERFDLYELSIDNCPTGAKWHGDDDAGGGADGAQFRLNRWEGGAVTNCTAIGIDMAYVDMVVMHNKLVDLLLADNTGVALRIQGARFTDLEGVVFEGNTQDLEMLDGDDADFAYENTVIDFCMDNGSISSDMSFEGLCQDVVFRGVEFLSGTYTLTAPVNAITTVDCTETGEVALDGTDTTKFTRSRTVQGDWPSTFGLTTDNAATMAWSYNMVPGEKVHLEAIVIANGRNSADHAVYHIARSANRPGSTLAYDGQTVNFTVGDTIIGGTSGASATIIADADSGATGTLTLRDIDGEFEDNEVIVGDLGGTAIANGTLSHQNAALLGSTTSIEVAVETDTDFACDFAVAADDVKIEVTGDTSKTVEWTVSVKVTSA